ncbi:MAG: DUF2523 domain-containing protein [Neisseriaceae bacterium]|nr:DUF2523 domain-containing protein [Neisseriaceae bacterium]MBR1819966.1 DUF2523 domain-containing protein [Neisseriaceae bacterium]
MDLPLVGVALGTLLRALFGKLLRGLGLWLFNGFKSLGVMLVVWLTDRLFAFLGSLAIMGFVYIGVDLLIDKVIGGILGSVGGVPDAIFQIFVLAGFTEAINIIVSAIAFAITIKMSKVSGSSAGANTP